MIFSRLFRLLPNVRVIPMTKSMKIQFLIILVRERKKTFVNSTIVAFPLFVFLGWSTSQGNAFNYATSLAKEIVFRPTSSYSIPQPQVNVIEHRKSKK